jgi:glycosyltransferase involved in cell wall biosynthesis
MMKYKNRDHFVSVVIPVFNGENIIGTCIKSILKQSYPNEKYEIIIVDNGSTDTTREIIKRYPVKMLIEDSIRSSYGARNTGIKHANGDIIAFIDADCVAYPTWLEEGVRVLLEQSGDLAGGNVEFTYRKKSPAEFYDSITNMQNKYEIKENNVAKTANLFVRSEVFKEIGLFPQTMSSGGDVAWTYKATSNSYMLIYAENAVVKHPARGLLSLAKKHYRVGKGHLDIWLSGGKQQRDLMKGIVSFFPPRLKTVKKLVEERGTPEMRRHLIGMWCAAIIIRLSGDVGRISSLIERMWRR